MLPSDPNWLSADAALWSAIFAALSLLATGVGIIVAVFALRWARTAAVEAGKQAAAALDAVKWSQKAAEAAQGQIEILEKQIELSEPQPVVLLHLSYLAWEPETGWSMSLENVGEELAFDIQVSALYTALAGASIATMLRFPPLPVLRVKEIVALAPVVDPPIRSFGEKVALSQAQRFMHVLLTAQEQEAKKRGMTEKNICKDIITVRYRNARGRRFEMEFALWMRGFIRFEAEPHGSLVSRQLRETPAVSVREFFSVSEGADEILKASTLHEAAKLWSENMAERSVYHIRQGVPDQSDGRITQVPSERLKCELGGE